MRQKLTKRQAEVMNYICQYWLARGKVPTYRQIGIIHNNMSPNAVTGHVKALAKKGWLVLHRGSAFEIAGLKEYLRERATEYFDAMLRENNWSGTPNPMKDFQEFVDKVNAQSPDQAANNNAKDPPVVSEDLDRSTRMVTSFCRDSDIPYGAFLEAVEGCSPSDLVVTVEGADSCGAIPRWIWVPIQTILKKKIEARPKKFRGDSYEE